MFKAPFQFLKQLIVGPQTNNDPLPRQGWVRGKELILEEWNKPSYSVMRMTRLFLISISFLFPTVHIDQLTRSTERWVVACLREPYYAGRAMFLVVALLTPLHKSMIVVVLVIYFALDILFHLAGGALVWGRYSIHPQRSLLLALINYCETTIAFAVLYLHFDCISWQSPSATATQALYFSFVTATTVGYGDLVPSNPLGQRIVAIQLAVFVVFVLLFIAVFVSRVDEKTKA